LPVERAEDFPTLGLFIPEFLKFLKVIDLQHPLLFLAPYVRPEKAKLTLDRFKGHRNKVAVTDREFEQFGGGSVIHRRESGGFE
jgi:hypothetical protein